MYDTDQGQLVCMILIKVNLYVQRLEPENNEIAVGE